VINPRGGLGVVAYKFSENGPREEEGHGSSLGLVELTSQTALNYSASAPDSLNFTSPSPGLCNQRREGTNAYPIGRED
jgi:hypothetical protein